MEQASTAPPKLESSREVRDTTASPELRASMREALATERQRIYSVAAWVRLAGTVLFLGLATYLWKVSGLLDWGVYVPILSGYAGLAGVLCLFRRHHWLTRAAAVAALIDVAAIYLLQSTTLPLSPFPSGVAGFSLGLFALLVSLSSLTLSTSTMLLTAAVAAVAQVSLMHQAQVGQGAMVAAVLVLSLLAVVTAVAVGRLRNLAVDLSETDLRRSLEVQRRQASEENHRLIKQLLDEAEDRNTRMARLQSDKDHLTQLLVHDLRSPLTAITVTLDLIKLKLRIAPTSAELPMLVHRAQETTERLAQMTDDILDIAKLEDGKLIPQRLETVLTDLLEQAKTGLSPMAGRRQIDVVVSAEAVSASIDRSMFLRVIENLLSNALRYVPESGRIGLTAKPEGEGLQIAVHNNGPAIEPGRRAVIFDKFEQGSDKNRGGWGLGLYFCRLAVELHGGTITVEDVEGWPCSFVIRLPG